jgi:hydroxymethylbilane synthase
MLAAGIDDPTAAAALAAERAVIARLGGGCQMPIGAYAAVDGVRIRITAVVVSLDGARAAHATADGALTDPRAVGTLVAERLIAEGADDIIADVMRAHAAVEGLQP